MKNIIMIINWDVQQYIVKTGKWADWLHCLLNGKKFMEKLLNFFLVDHFLSVSSKRIMIEFNNESYQKIYKTHINLL